MGTRLNELHGKHIHGITTVLLYPTKEFFLCGDIIFDCTKRIAVINDQNRPKAPKKKPGKMCPSNVPITLCFSLFLNQIIQIS